MRRKKRRISHYQDRAQLPTKEPLKDNINRWKELILIKPKTLTQQPKKISKRNGENRPHYVNHHREMDECKIQRESSSRKREAEEAEANTSHDKGAKNNFESWGKRCKIDIEHVKELRDRMNAKAKPRKKTNMTKIHASWYLTILMLLYFIASAMGTTQPSGLIAYDCANPDVNMTSYSLLDVMSCMPSTRNLSVSEIPIQVLQRSAKSTAMVYQCKMIMYGSGCSSFSVRQ